MKQIENVDCFACGKKQLSKDEVGLNKKLIGRGIKQFYCMNCFAEYFDVSTEELLVKIKDFKEQGCEFF